MLLSGFVSPGTPRPKDWLSGFLEKGFEIFFGAAFLNWASTLGE